MNLEATGQPWRILIATLLPRVVLIATLTLGIGANADERSQANRIHDRLAGVPASPAELDALEQALVRNPLDAAFIAMEHPAFYNVTLKNFAAPWTNREADVFVPLMTTPQLLSAWLEITGTSAIF